MDGTRRWLNGSDEYALDHRLERGLVDLEGPRDRRTHRDFDRDDDAAILVGIHDPAQTAEEHGALLVAWMLQVVHRLEHAFENMADILVEPVLRLAHDPFNCLGRGEVLASQPHIH